MGKTFPREDFFHLGKQKKSHLGQGWVNRDGGAWGSFRFWSKTAALSTVWAGALVDQPSRNGQMRLRQSSKKIH